MTEINDNDLVAIEVESTCANLTVGRHLVGYGKNRLEVLGKELALFQDYVEPELGEWKRANDKFQKALERVAVSVKDPKDTDEVEFQKALLTKKHGPTKRFRDDNSRDPKPLLSVSILENKGRQFTKEEILERENQENRVEQKAMLEVLKSMSAPRDSDSKVAALEAQLDEMRKMIDSLTKGLKK